MLIRTLTLASIVAASSFVAAADRAPLPPLPKEIASFGAAISGDALYVIGGHVGDTHAHSKENLNYDFYSLNLADPKKWETLEGGVGLQSVALVAYEGSLYRVGGLSALNAPGEEEDLHSVADFLRYDTKSAKWSKLEPLPEPRSSHDAVVMDGYLYVIGGWVIAGDDAEAQWPANDWRMNLANKDAAWEPITAMPIRVRALDVATANNTLYAFGGFRSDGKVSDTSFAYDPAAKKWTELVALPMNGFAVSAEGIGSAVYATGQGGELQRFDTIDQSWKSLGKVQTERFFHRLVAENDSTLLAIGGAAPRGSHLASVDRISVETAHAVDISETTIAYPGKAKNRQAAFLHNGALYLFGGNNSLERHNFNQDNFLSEGYKVDLVSNKVTTVASLPQPRQSMVTIMPASDPNVGYALGGFAHNGEVALTQAGIFAYNFKDDSWKAVDAPLPLPTTQFALVQRGNTFWMLGGMDFDPRRGTEDQFHILRNVWKWETVSKTVAALEVQLPQPRRAHAGAILGSKFYLVGGMKENFEPVVGCDVFDLDTQEWSTIPAPRATVISPEIAVHNGRLYLACGSVRNDAGDLSPNASIEAFDPATNTWQVVVEKLPVVLPHTRMLADEEGLVLFSTHHKDTSEISIVSVRLP